MVTLSLKQFVKFLLLFIVLVLLLTCYQLVGNSVIQAFGLQRQPDVWLHLANQAIHASEDEGLQSAQVDSAYQDFEVIAPPNREVVLLVNEIEVETRRSPGTPLRFTHVRLREDRNTVRAVLLGGTDVFEPKSARLLVWYRPPKSESAIVLGTPYLDPQNGHLVVGALLPLNYPEIRVRT